jgi:hypothetical protein
MFLWPIDLIWFTYRRKSWSPAYFYPNVCYTLLHAHSRKDAKPRCNVLPEVGSVWKKGKKPPCNLQFKLQGVSFSSYRY